MITRVLSLKTLKNWLKYFIQCITLLLLYIIALLFYNIVNLSLLYMNIDSLEF